MRSWYWCLAFTALCGQARAVETSHVDGERFRLRWSAGASCPSEMSVGAEVLRLLDASPKADAPPLEVQAHVSSTTGGFTLSLTLGKATEARTRFLTAPSCEELAHAAALVIALAIDPSLATGATVTDDRAPGSAPPLVPSKGVAPLAASQPCSLAPGPPPKLLSTATLSSGYACPRCERCSAKERERSARSAGLLLATGIAAGVLPESLPRPGIGVAYASGPHWAELALNAAFAAVGPRGDSSGARFQLWSATPRFCLRAIAGSVEIGPCASAEVGWLRARGIGLPAPRSHDSIWIAPALGAQLALTQTGGARLVLNLDAALSTTRFSFELAGQKIFEPWLVTPSLRLAALLNAL